MLGNHRELSLTITETYYYAEKLLVLVENVKKDHNLINIFWFNIVQIKVWYIFELMQYVPSLSII